MPRGRGRESAVRGRASRQPPAAGPGGSQGVRVGAAAPAAAPGGGAGGENTGAAAAGWRRLATVVVSRGGRRVGGSKRGEGGHGATMTVAAAASVGPPPPRGSLVVRVPLRSHGPPPTDRLPTHWLSGFGRTRLRLAATGGGRQGRAAAPRPPEGLSARLACRRGGAVRRAPPPIPTPPCSTGAISLPARSHHRRGLAKTEGHYFPRSFVTRRGGRVRVFSVDYTPQLPRPLSPAAAARRRGVQAQRVSRPPPLSPAARGGSAAAARTSGAATRSGQCAPPQGGGAWPPWAGGATTAPGRRDGVPQRYLLHHPCEQRPLLLRLIVATPPLPSLTPPPPLPSQTPALGGPSPPSLYLPAGWRRPPTASQPAVPAFPAAAAPPA